MRRRRIWEKGVKLFWLVQSVVSDLGYCFFLRWKREGIEAFLSGEDRCLGVSRLADTSDTLVFVGAGPFPYSAFYYGRRFKRVMVLENNSLLAILARWNLRREKNIVVCCADGRTFDYPEGSTVIVSLLTQGKQQVVEKARQDGAGYIVVRLPTERSRFRYEQVAIERRGESYTNEGFATVSVLVGN